MNNTKKTNLLYIIDDDEIIVYLTGKTLRKHDFNSEIKTFCHGLEALENLKNIPQTGEQWPDIILLDLNMPELSGIEVAREIIRLRLTCFVVICSVECDPELIAAAQLAGVLGYVLKRRLTKDLVLAVKRAACGEVFISGAEPGRPTILL